MNSKKRIVIGKEKIAALSIAAILAVGMGSVNASAETVTGAKEGRFTGAEYFNSIGSQEDNTENKLIASERYKSLDRIINKSVWAYNRKNVTVNGKSLSVKGLKINGIDYIPFRQSANALGAGYTYNSITQTSVMNIRGLNMSATAGNYVIYANDRPLFNTSPTVIMNDGRMYIPAEAFAKAVGMRVSSSSSAIGIGGTYSPLKPAADFYSSDEVFWLARIIHAESRGEPLIGEIAVGNVVLNRVKSRDYPSTIYGVIFDRKYGVQFSPIKDGSIYNDPSYNSILAAKICLEGFDLSEGALFFLRPETSVSSWIPSSRPYAFSIGKHDFYK